MKLRYGNLTIAGFMSCGKDKVGGIIAARTGMPFISTDKLIRASYGNMPITKIFDELGEPTFRQRERDIVAEVYAKSGQIVGLGGGTTAQPPERGGDAVRGLIRARSVWVWLDVDFPILRARLAAKNDDRPLARDPVAMEKLFWARREYYGQADIRIHVDVEVPAEEVAERVFQQIDWQQAA